MTDQPTAVETRAREYFEDDLAPLRWKDATPEQRTHYRQLATDVIAERRPVPRFEVVHKPRRAMVLDVVERSFLDDETTLHQTVATEVNPQPWHTRVIGGNGEPLMSTETYVDEESAYDVILAVARMFGHTDARIVTSDGTSSVDALAPGVEGHVWDLVGVDVDGVEVRVPILRVEVEA